MANIPEHDPTTVATQKILQANSDYRFVQNSADPLSGDIFSGTGSRTAATITNAQKGIYKP